MSLRKEQVLLLVVLAFAAWQYKGIQAEAAVIRGSFDPQVEEYAVAAVRPAILAEPAPAPEVPARDLFLEPSETQPLPPRPLPFPDAGPLSVVPLPLDPGPDFGHVHVMRVPGTVAEDVEFQVAGPAESQGGGAGTDLSAAPEQDPKERFAKVYDRIDTLARGSFIGIIEHPDKIALEQMNDWSGMEVTIRRYNTRRDQLEPAYDVSGEEIVDITLAQNLRNEVERRKRAVPQNAGHLRELGNLIEWLLDQARVESWVYEEALAMADVYIRLTGGDVEGLRWKVRVLRAKGDLAGEFELYQNLPEPLQDSAFRYAGLGRLEARLGLYEWAEQHLRTAVEKAPGDPRVRATLARFLLERDRPRAALPHARRAASMGGLTRDDERLHVHGALVEAHLALGDLEAARDALGGLPGGGGAQLLRASVAYARGDLDTALGGFQAATREGVSQEALLGVAACQTLMRQWQDARDSFETLAREAPLLRHRAYTGLAFLYARTGNRSEALSALERAKEADPEDPYAYYLTGHELRLAGQLQEAIGELEQALTMRDDFLHALAETALCYRALAASEVDPVHAAQLLTRAARYANRLVELERRGSPSVEFLELQGTLHFEASDLRAAGTAFGAGLDAAGGDEQALYCRAGLALVDYARGRTEEALERLQRMQRDLPREHPYRVYAEETVARIDDHSQKEMMLDRFERESLGGVWVTEQDGSLGARLEDGAMVFEGEFSRSTEVWAQRQDAVSKGGNFLAVQASMKLGSRHARRDSFAGLRVRTQSTRGRTSSDFEVELGLFEGEPWLRILDGRQGDPSREADREPVRGFGDLIPAFDPTAVQELELRVVPRDEQGQQFDLLCIWNGAIVHEREVRTLRKTTSNELLTELVVRGAARARVDVTFDDYRLERRGGSQ